MDSVSATTSGTGPCAPAVLKRRIFIGSSSEGLERASQVSQLIASDTTTAQLWSGIFEPGYLTFEALEQMLAEADAAVFIATPDDKAIIRGRNLSVPRANILLEFGLVAGRLGRHNIAICQYGGTELPSDLKGLTVIEMDPPAPPPDAPASFADDFRRHSEDLLKAWSSRLLPTAEMVPRTETVHGYTGKWTFDMHLDHWRGVEIDPLSYAEGSGSVELFVDATGKTGHGLVWGHLTFKLMNHDMPGQAPFQGELRFCHEISDVVCDVSGGVCFTTRTFALQKMMASGSRTCPSRGRLRGSCAAAKPLVRSTAVSAPTIPGARAARSGWSKRTSRKPQGRAATHGGVTRACRDWTRLSRRSAISAPSASPAPASA
jgi:predicted nucleotide-binding protein with TIR-like domain